MAASKSAIRRSVSLPSRVARRVEALAKQERRTANGVIIELIENGLEARERERRTFFEMADRLARTEDVSEQRRLKAELARLTFGK